MTGIRSEEYESILQAGIYCSHPFSLVINWVSRMNPYWMIEGIPREVGNLEEVVGKKKIRTRS